MSIMAEEKYITIAEAAKSRRVGRDTIHRLINNGELPAQRIGKVWRIKESDWLEYLKKGETRRNE